VFLTAAEADALDALAARAEARTGVRIVPAVTGKSGVYAELPWMAFALGASLAGLALVAADAAWPPWVTANTAILHTIAILGTGAAAALSAVLAPPFARLFLHASLAHAEVRRYAESLFLRHALFSSRGRAGVLVLVSLFERRIEILADEGLRARVTETDWQTVVARITPHLRDGRAFHGLQEGVTAVEALLVSKGCLGGVGEAVEGPHRPIEERGE
jgi:putative membrane protein